MGYKSQENDYKPNTETYWRNRFGAIPTQWYLLGTIIKVEKIKISKKKKNINKVRRTVRPKRPNKTDPSQIDWSKKTFGKEEESNLSFFILLFLSLNSSFQKGINYSFPSSYLTWIVWIHWTLQGFLVLALPRRGLVNWNQWLLPFWIFHIVDAKSVVVTQSSLAW